MCPKPTLADDLLERASGSSPRSQAKRNIAQFLACKEDICDALGKGWNMRAIWEILHERRRFLGQYNCFTLYVRKYIRLQDPSELQGEPLPPVQKEQPRPANKATTKTRSVPAKGIQDFHYDPNDDVSELMTPASEE